MTRIPLFLFSEKVAQVIARPFEFLGHHLKKVRPGLHYDLAKTDLTLSAEEYATASFFNAIIYFLVFFGLLTALSMTVQERTLDKSLFIGISAAFGIFLLIWISTLRFPKVLAVKKAREIDKYLVFALKDLLLQVGAGVSLYHAMLNVARSNYGLISNEFRKAVKRVSAGEPLEAALEDIAINSESEFLRRTMWQLVNTMKAGASLKGALTTIINNLTAFQKNKIKSYSHELNVLSLMYMMFAVAIPTVGATMLVILSSFAGVGISRPVFVLFLIVCFFIQIALIGLIKTRRPVVHI